MKKNIAKDLFGRMDIYLIDQILKGNYDECNSILDVGCGSGRNIEYFLKNDFDVYGLDPHARAIENVRRQASRLTNKNLDHHFMVEQVEKNSLPTASFDLVICNAVLHFAKNQNHFENMLFSTWKLIKPGGFLFCRLASNIGIEGLVRKLDSGQYLLPDKSVRFLVTEEMLLNYTDKMNGSLQEYIKTTNVQNLRCMTTWCLKKEE